MSTDFFKLGTYFPSEEIVAKLVPRIFQAAFEVRGATFLNGKCGGHRVTGQSATIIFNASSTFTGNVTVHSVWSKSYSSGVSVVTPFVLYPLVPALEDVELNLSKNEEL